MNISTNIGEVSVRKLNAVEGREIDIHMALLNKSDLKLDVKSKEINLLYFKRLCIATGLKISDFEKLDDKSLGLIEEEYHKLNNLGGVEEKDF